MSRRLILSLSLACIVLGAASWILQPPEAAAVQVEASEIQPFTLTRLHILSDFTSGGEVLRYESVFAEDSRGSTVELREPLVEGGEGARIVVNTETEQRVVIEPLSRSVTTYGLPDTAVRQELEASRCAQTAVRQQILGIEVFLHREVRDLSGGRKSETERWLAPSLGCIVLSETASLVDNEGTLSTQAVEAISLSLGSPSADLFSIPSDFVERSPSQVAAERARLYPDVCPECTAPSGRQAQQDAAYFNSRNR